MQTKKLQNPNIEQKKVIFDIMKNELNPDQRIEEEISEQKLKQEKINNIKNELEILTNKKESLDVFFVKYSFLAKTKENEYQNITKQIENNNKSLEEFGILNSQNTEITNKIGKYIEDLLDLKNNRENYSEKFLETRKKTINNIKKALIDKDASRSAEKEAEKDIQDAKDIGIDLSKNKQEMINELLAKYQKTFDEIDILQEDQDKKEYIDQIEKIIKNNKSKENKAKKMETEEIESEPEIGKKAKTMDLIIDLTGKTPQIQIIRSDDEKYTRIVNELGKIKGEENIPANHIDNILGRGTYTSTFALGSVLGIELENIKKLYRLSDKGFNVKKIDEEILFMINFFKTINDDRTMDIFSTMEKNMTLGESRSIKQAKNKIREFLQPTTRIKPILDLSESMNIQNRFKKIIDEEKIPELQRLIGQHDKLIKETFDEIKEAKNNDECIDATNNGVEEYLEIYNSVRDILAPTKIKEKNKSLDDIMKEMFDYLGIWYVLGGSAIGNKDSFIAEQLLFMQLLHHNSKYISAKDINKLRDMLEFLVWQREKIEEIKINNNVKVSLKNLYNTILTSIDIFINQAIVKNKVQNIVRNKDIIEEDTDENVDNYKELADKYFSLLPDINTIGDDNIIINNNKNIKDVNKEMINPIVIKSDIEGQDDSLMISIGNLDQLIIRERTRQEIQEKYKLDTKVAEDKIKKTMYSSMSIGKFKFLIPNEIDGIGTVYIHKNGEISVDGMTGHGAMETLGDLDYERFRAWVFYYIYEANSKIDKRGLGNPYEELGLSKPPSPDDIIIEHDPRYIYSPNIQNSGIQRIVKYKKGFVRLLRVGRTTGENAIENVNKLNSEGAEIRLFARFFGKGADPMIDEPIRKIEITEKTKLEILEIQNKINTSNSEFVCFDTWVSEHKKDENAIAPTRVKIAKMHGISEGFVKKLNEIEYVENKENPKTEKTQKDVKDKEKIEISEEINELSKKILAFFKTRGLKIQGKEKIFKKDLIRLAKSALGAREFDFARYENIYEINEEKDLIRKNIKKRANENGREGSYEKPK